MYATQVNPLVGSFHLRKRPHRAKSSILEPLFGEEFLRRVRAFGEAGPVPEK
ncbi:hypothetical protein ACFQXA_31760 [Nocardiopsis composta]